MGLIRNEDYASATVFLENLDFPLSDIAQEKNIFVWGTGERAEYFFKSFAEINPDVEIMGCIDSNPSKKGKTFHRRPIFSPDEIIDREDVFVIVATTLHYEEVAAFLQEHGKQETKDYIHMYAINHYASKLARETIYDRPRHDFVCQRPFKHAELGGEGRMTSCCGINHLLQWNTPVYYSEFEHVWHSNVMKVIRLSMINGTYSFCNPLKCNYIYDDEKQQIDTNELSHAYSWTREELDEIGKRTEYPVNTLFDAKRYEIREDEYPSELQCSFDKSCNLRCASCREQVYIASNAERKRLDNFAEKLKRSVLPHIERIKFSGGEVCVSPTYHKIIFDPDNFHIRKVQMISNGSIFTEDFFEKLKGRFDETVIMISMDGATKETAEKLRRGIDFDKWKTNMEFLSQMRKENQIQKLYYNFVVQRDNYMEMADYVKMCLSYHADSIKFSRLMNWLGSANEEYEKIAMWDSLGRMKPELEEIVSDEIFQRPEVRLFKWVNLFIQ